MGNDTKHVIVIGGGVGGLAAAIRIAAARTCRVTLLEKNDRVGGKLNLWQAAHPARPNDRPFRFDTGPSLLTLPFVFEALFRAAGEDIRDHLSLRRLDPIARYVWGDGTTFDLRSGRDDLEREIARISPQDVAGWRAFADRGREIWDLSAELFLFHAPEQILAGKVDGKTGDEPQSPLARLRAAWAMLSVPVRIGMFTNFARMVDRCVAGRKLREVLYQYATYSGASPFRAPATLAVIPHAEQHFGGWYVEGGMYRIAEALAGVARKLGVDVRSSCAVERVLVSGGVRERGSGGVKARSAGRAVVKGVRLADGSEIPADAVVANSDVVYSYRNLIDPAHRKRFSDAMLDKIEPGGSGMVLLLGVEGTYPQLAHHNKFMPADYRSDVTAMFETHSVPDDPCIYVCATTRTDPTQAPDGCENLFVLASAPALDGRLDWEREGPRYREQLVRTLETRWGLTDLSSRIVVERRITPADLQSLYNANAGSIYGIGSNSRRNAFLRPPNRDRAVRGLYFAGGATHPGGGLPLVALSGKIVSEMVAEDLG